MKHGESGAYENLKKMILTVELKPGERIWEQQLANQFGVSRTPVREAIKRLEAEKLVEVIPHKGVIVANIKPEDILEFFEVRAVLEGFAAKLAIDHIGLKDIERMEAILEETERALEIGNAVMETALDSKFHEIIWKDNSYNSKLINILSGVTEQMMRFRILSLGVKGRTKIVIQQHKSIVTALKERNKDVAELEITKHILGAKDHLLKKFSQGGFLIERQ